MYLYVGYIPKIQEALDVINAWGFQYKTNAFTWVKKNKKADSLFWGMGRWTRSNAEICLLAVKGSPKRLDMGVHSVIYAPIDKHSKKPQETRDRIIRLVGDLPKVELFAVKFQKVGMFGEMKLIAMSFFKLNYNSLICMTKSYIYK